MKEGILILAVCAALASCADAPVAEPFLLPENVYGAFAGVAPEIESRLAEEAVRHLARLYPPAETLLDFQQEIGDGDGFGQALLRAAQVDGYVIRRNHVPGTPPRCGRKPAPRKDGETRHPVPACYLVDGVGGWLRLTLYVAGDVWSRLFAGEAGGLRPAGAWTHWSER
ncbi:MAG: hypothetical protein LBD06_09655 [Candidatus Accumulibacter sp.]|jgi:hypothetical protein|nr:hypothetical protein [Accumulibacter sp.]